LTGFSFISQIHGLDWSPTHENQLATSSQDCTVKFFDITNPRRAESILTTSSPVWRARYTVSIDAYSFQRVHTVMSSIT